MNPLLDALYKKGHKAFLRPYELNIVGVRSDSTRPNAFDDTIYVFYRDKEGKLVQHHFAATTDPGTYWLENPMSPKGTAVLKEGQYLDSHAIGLHRGKYKALVQQKSVTVLRDYDRNAVLDFQNGNPDTGLFGINIHHAAGEGTTKAVDRYSAGCQVFASVRDFDGFMRLCDRHRLLYGNRFTYTLMDERAVNREAKKNFSLPLAA